MRTLITSGAIAAALLLSACGEKPQLAATRKSDVPPWQGAQNPFVVQGWTAGDKTAWEQQLLKRSQGQNEYSRAPVRP